MTVRVEVSASAKAEIYDFDCTALQVVGPRPAPGMTLETLTVGQRHGPPV